MSDGGRMLARDVTEEGTDHLTDDELERR